MNRFLLDGRYGAVLQSFSLQPVEVLKKAGLPVTLFTQEHPVVTQDAYFRLMTAISDLMPDESVPIRMATMESIETFSPPIPSVVAKAIDKAVNQKRPKTCYVIGFGAKPLIFLHSILPARCFDWIMMHAS